jgi:hypothetical protein
MSFAEQLSFWRRRTGEESKVYGEMRSEPVPFLCLFSAKCRRNRATVFRLAGRERLAGGSGRQPSLQALGRATVGWVGEWPPATH